MFNHESPLRPPHFVTCKIIEAALDISDGRREPLRLGLLNVSRDWGWSPEYVEAMWAMLQTDCGQDYVIATGSSYTLREFVAAAFAEVGLERAEHVVHDPSLMRRSESAYSCGNADRARRELGWSARLSMPGVVGAMVRELRHDGVTATSR